jgi:PBP1b-binding outer membrane lipoprotein LpoB
MSSMRKLLLPAALTLLLAACGKDEAPVAATTSAPAAATIAPAASTPAAAAQSMAKAFQANDVASLLQTAVPKSAYNQMKSKFETEMASKVITEEERKEFADNLAKLTGPTAIDDLMAQVEPQLVALKPQMSGYVAMGVAGMQMAINSPENTDLTDSQKAQAGAVLNGLQGWAMKTDFADASKARAALTDIANAVKATSVTSLDQIKAMKFEEALSKGSILLAGLKKALGNYGLDLDAIVASQKVVVLSESGDTAKIKTSMTVFDVPVESESELVKIDGNWYAKDSVDGFKKMMAE